MQPSSVPPGLRDLQSALLALVRARDGVTAAFASEPGWATTWRSLVRSDTRAQAPERLDVYANMYFLRLEEVLGLDYPQLRRAVGGGPGFRALVTEYLLVSPSTNPSVRHVGEALAGFLAKPGRILSTGTPLGAASWFRPWLEDLAALETARADVFDAADAETWDEASIRALSLPALTQLTLRVVPAHRSVELTWDVGDFWRVATDDTEPVTPDHVPVAVLVWRQEHGVYHRALSPLEHRALRFVGEHTPSMEEFCAWLGQTEPDPEVAARDAFELVGGWVAGGLLEKTPQR